MFEQGKNAGMARGLTENFIRVEVPCAAPGALRNRILPVQLLRPGGMLVTPKGSSVEEEIADADAALDMLRAEVAQPIVLPAVSDRERTEREEAERPRVVIVRRMGDLDDRYPRRPGIPSKRPLGGSRASGGAR